MAPISQAISFGRRCVGRNRSILGRRSAARSDIYGTAAVFMRFGAAQAAWADLPITG